ncbi:MAG: hypothetical protein JWQ98_1426 [Chlorobi bacterium]|nr:hypothetical protein [Chlorobiota bacterium]
MNRKPYAPGKIIIGRLPLGADLLASITRIANDEEIKAGTVAVYGSLTRLTLSSFDQATKMPSQSDWEEGMEIGSLGGTISQFKGRSMARLSGTFARGDGSMVGGTIAIGTRVYACEVVITELTGGTLTRDFDPATGLPLWKDGSLLIEA